MNRRGHHAREQGVRRRPHLRAVVLERLVSQERLAEAIGLTFQQVQKYERAANRVSASKLWEVSKALSTNIAYFYEGLPDLVPPVGADAPRDAVQDFLMTSEGIELASIFPQVPRGRVRRRILDLVRALAGDAEPEAPSGD